MRTLNKIVLINSANVRYAEVKLDGNVHFIGTQGVGKSTILRAILFFYSADKQHLGIPREKRSFDEFYLPHSNSYIVYEVATEHGHFCVLTFRHSGRAAFRIIDAPYDCCWLVDETGAVTSESPTIRSRLGGRYMSRIIEHYDEYRDIIYGNRHAVGREFAPYALMESKNYQNIPRSITNVFLNSKVDADFIKDIIIRSMAEEEPGIDLGYYRRQVAEFENEYRDISRWYERDRKGEFPVRKRAEGVVAAYRQLLFLGDRIAEDAAEIQAAIKDAGERIPLLQDQLEKLMAEHVRQVRLLSELKGKFEKENGELLKEIGIREDKLKSVRSKRKRYADLNIEQVLQRSERESVLEAALSEQKRNYEILTEASNDIKTRYEKLTVNLRAGQQQFFMRSHSRMDELRQQRNDKTAVLLKEKDDRKKKGLELYQAERATLDEELRRQQKESVRTEADLKALAFSRPLAERTDALKEQLRELDIEARTSESELRALASQEARMLSEYDIQQRVEALRQSLADARKRLDEYLDGSGWEVELSGHLREEEIRQRISELEGAISEGKADLKKIKALKEQKAALDLRLGVIPGKIKALNLEIENLENEQTRQIKEKRAALEAALGELQGKISRAKESLDKQDAEFLKQQHALDSECDRSIADAKAGCDYALAGIQAEINERTRELNQKLSALEKEKNNELRGRGVDMDALGECEKRIVEIEAELRYIADNRQLVFSYNRDCEEYFEKEDRWKEEKSVLDSKRKALNEKYAVRESSDSKKLTDLNERIRANEAETGSLKQSIAQAEDFLVSNETSIPKVQPRETLRSIVQILDELRSSIMQKQECLNSFKQNANQFKGMFAVGNTFGFRQELTLDDDYMQFASSLSEFLINDKIEEYRKRTSERYVEILGRVSREMGDVTRNGSDVDKIIREINYDFKARNFVGAIKSIELRSVASADPMVQLLTAIKTFCDESSLVMGETNLFNTDGQADEANVRAVELLTEFMKCLSRDPGRTVLSLSDTFQLQFRIVENDNDTMWVEKISNVGSDGTDVLVKAMVNIMLINVFKEKVSRKFGDFRIHCMMDEIGKLHPSNIKGILDFANSRNILLVNSSPTTNNVAEYRHTYILSKNDASVTIVQPLITRKEAAVNETK